VLGDGYQAKMRESLNIYDPAARGIDMVPTEPFVGKPGKIGEGREAAHLRNAYSVEEELEVAMARDTSEYERVTPEIIEYDSYNTEGADIVVIAHGIVFRSAAMAVRELAGQGKKVGYFRPITLRPFPREQLQQAVARAKMLLVAESAYGQLLKLVKENLYGGPCNLPIKTILRPGVGITPEEVTEACNALLDGKGA
jgi:2-oxoglutarate ferredoxin oxidoreductase subunit alpha